MKKIITIWSFVMALALSINVGAACKDPGQNLSDGNIKSTYDCNTKELKAYGLNKYGELGTGDYDIYSKGEIIDINSKVENKRISDYIITKFSTYILTEDGNVYASGMRIGNGSKTKRNTFVMLKLYKGSQNKITNLHGVSDPSIYKDNGYEYGFDTAIYMNTAKKNVNYFYLIDLSFSDYKFPDNIKGIDEDDYQYTVLDKMYNNYPVYRTTSKNKIYNYQEDNNGRKLFTSTFDDSYDYEYKKYSNGKLYRYGKEDIKGIRYIKYNGGVKTYDSFIKYTSYGKYLYEGNKYIKEYAKGKLVSYQKYGHRYDKEDDYIYNYLAINKKYKRDKSGKLIQYTEKRYNSKRKITSYTSIKYKKNNTVTKKMIKSNYKKNKLYSRAHYKYNSKGKLASNKYGKATKTTVYYNNGKKVKTVKQKYNAKGKLVK